MPRINHCVGERSGQGQGQKVKVMSGDVTSVSGHVTSVSGHVTLVKVRSLT